MEAMSLANRLGNPRFRNWVKAGIGLTYLKEGLIHYVEEELGKFHANIVRLSVPACTFCTTANVVPCPTNGICKRNRGNCSFHDRADPAKCPTPCPRNTCNGIFTEISNKHRYGPPTWQNCDATKWTNNAWEVAKCFLPPGYSACRSINDIDCSGLLSLCMNATFIKLDIIIQLGKDVFSKVKKKRHDIFHSGNLALTDVELEQFLQLLIDLLSTYRKSIDKDAQDAINMLNKLKASDVNITANDVDAVCRENGIPMNYWDELIQKYLWYYLAVILMSCGSFYYVFLMDGSTNIKDSVYEGNRPGSSPISAIYKDQLIRFQKRAARLILDLGLLGKTPNGTLTIASRTESGARPPRDIEGLGTPVKIVLVHHTASGEPLTPHACAFELRNIQSYHMDERKWADIGYSFQISQDGRVYEGRGWDRVGAHTLGWNKVSISFAFMGDFTFKLPNKAAIDALQAVIEVGIQSGKIAPDYILCAHRDMRPTISPGEPLHNLLKTWSNYGPCPPPKPMPLRYTGQL